MFSLKGSAVMDSRWMDKRGISGSGFMTTKTRLRRVAAAGLCLLVATGCEMEPTEPSTLPEGSGDVTVATDHGGAASQPTPEVIVTAQTAAPPIGTSVPEATLDTSEAPEPTTQINTPDTGPTASTSTASPSNLPAGMQVTAIVTGLSYAIQGAPIFLYRLDLPFDDGGAALAVIDPDSGEPSTLVRADQPLWVDFSGFDADEPLDLGLYLLIPPSRGTVRSVGAGQVAAAKVSVDAAGSLREAIEVPACAPAGDYLLVACRDVGCALALESAASTRAAWLRFNRYAPPTADQPSGPAPALAQVDSVDGLNVRARPGVASRIVHHLAPNSVVVLTGARRMVQGAAWYPVRDPITCTEGWVNGSFLDLGSLPDAAAPEVEPPVGPTEPEPWMRPPDPSDAPQPDPSDVLQPNPSKVPPVEMPPAESPPSELASGSQAWVADSAGTSGGLNLRLGPGVRYDALDRLPPGRLVMVLQGPVSVGRSPWYEVRDEATGQQGWVNGDYLLSVNP